MALNPGTRLAGYEVIAQIGEGGMGQVYRARDTKLNRDVALKVLPESFATDPDRLARFQREAHVLASLNHPNIAHIHGLEESGGVTALVMELVEGEDLAQRIARGAIPLDDALPIAKQIAEALEAAHEQGIIHRDLKPANIKVRTDGTVKVLDFGLAKAMDPPAASRSVSQSPTITTPAMTHAGMILGTAAYMSPEQARGKAVDKRTDIWAFGCVLYEMLTAKRAFEGELISDVLASVLKTDPDWKVLASDTPVGLRGLLRRSLDKDPRRRLQAIGEARVQIEELLSSAREGNAAPTTAFTTQRMSHRRVLSIAVASGTVLIVASTLTTIWLTRRAPPTQAPVRFTIVPPASQEFARVPTLRDLAVSPDGTRLAYIAVNRLMVREMNELDAAPLGDVRASLRSPFFSPDGRSIGFFTQNADGEIQRASIASGSLMRVSGYSGIPRGGSWSSDNSIVFATNDAASGLLRVSSSGGEPTVLTTPDTAHGELDHLFPSVLPNGQAVLFTIQRTSGSLQNADVGVLDLTTGRRKVLIRGSQAEYVKSGHLVYAVEGMLNAVRFDLARLEVVGEPVRVIDQMMIGQLLGVNFAVSQEGMLVYLPASASAQLELRSLVWVTRDGREEPLTAAGRRPYAAARLSPDGTRVALDIRDQSSDIWIWELSRQTLTPLTHDPGGDTSPVWMPDGQRIVWASARGNDTGNLYWQAADGTGAAERLTTSTAVQFPTSVSPDGSRLVLFGNGPSAGRSFGISLVTLSGPLPRPPGDWLEPESLLGSSADQQDGEISPDGQWIAYQSNESGRFEVYVRPFPHVEAGRVPISPRGGTRPAWARNGRELFYLDADGYLTTVPVQTAGTTFIPGKPTRLFNRRYYAGLSARGRDLREYDVASDAQRFLMIKNGENDERPASLAGMVVVLNWGEELKRLVPTK